MKSRLLVSAVGVPLILVVILWAPVWVLAAALAALAGIAGWEMMKCVGAEKARPLGGIAVAGAVAHVLQAYRGSAFLTAVLVVLTLGIFAYAVFRAGEVKFLQICAALFSMFAIPYAFASFLRLDAAGYHRGFLLLPLLFSFASDTFAFFVGRAFCRHKLAPKVSPHKTVEGALGGLLGNVVGGLIFALVMNICFDHAISYLGIALLGLGCSVVAQLGDLSFSLIKREFGVKDYGRIFLEHGGVLDRFDSVLFVAPVLALLLPVLP